MQPWGGNYGWRRRETSTSMRASQRAAARSKSDFARTMTHNSRPFAPFPHRQ